MFVLFNDWYRMMLLILLMNFGGKVLVIVLLILVWIVGLIVFFEGCLLRYIELILEVIMMIVLWKLIIWFLLLVRWLLLRICRKSWWNLCVVFLILLMRMREYGLCLIVLVSWLLVLCLMYLGLVLMRCEMVCFLEYLEVLIWIIVFLLLNIIFVNVLVSNVLLVLDGLISKNEVMGWFWLLRLDWLSWMVLVIDLIVFGWLMIFLEINFLRWRSLVFLVLINWDMGIFVYWVIILVIIFGVICWFEFFLVFFCFNFWSFCLCWGIEWYWMLVVVVRLYLSERLVLWYILSF